MKSWRRKRGKDRGVGVPGPSLPLPDYFEPENRAVPMLTFNPDVRVDPAVQELAMAFQKMTKRKLRVEDPGRGHYGLLSIAAHMLTGVSLSGYVGYVCREHVRRYRKMPHAGRVFGPVAVREWLKSYMRNAAAVLPLQVLRVSPERRSAYWERLRRARQALQLRSSVRGRDHLEADFRPFVGPEVGSTLQAGAVEGRRRKTPG